MTARRRWIAWLKWGLALVALLFVVWVVPVRDRCQAPGLVSTRAAVSRDETGCTLYLRSGEVHIDGATCAGLQCEPGLQSTLLRAKATPLVGLGVLYVLGSFAWAVRWWLLLSLMGIRFSVFRAWRVSLEAQAGGILLPGGVGGDALRIGSLVAEGAPMGTAVASVLLDRALGLATLASLALGLGAALGGTALGLLGQLLAVIPVGFVVGLGVLRSAWLGRQVWLVESRLFRPVAPVLEYLRDPQAPRALGWGLVVSLWVSGLQLLVVRGLVAALGATAVDEARAFSGMALAFVASAVPVLPGGWGTSDAAFVYFLGAARVSAGVALAVCLLYRLFWYASGLVGAVLVVLGGAGKRSKS